MAAEIIFEPELSERTTLRLGGTARAEIMVREARDLDELPKLIEKHGARPLYLGKGSNILARDGDLDLILVRSANSEGPKVVGESGAPDRNRVRDQVRDRVRIRAGAGLMLPALLGRTARMGLTGLEGLTGIPGELGGSMAMNAGSYGTELADAVTRVRIWTPSRGLEWADIADCRTGYRSFAPPDSFMDETGGFLVTEVELELEKGDRDAIKKRMRDVYEKKKATQPVQAWTCGCVFKNPESGSAGLMLDKAGFRGKRLGGMELSSMHANFLVNRGGGTSEQALELIESARAAVRKMFETELETEVVIVP